MKVAGVTQTLAKAVADLCVPEGHAGGPGSSAGRRRDGQRVVWVAVSAGTAVEQALGNANKAGEATARTMHKDLMDLHEVARSVVMAAAEAVTGGGNTIHAKGTETLGAASMIAEPSQHDQAVD